MNIFLGELQSTFIENNTLFMTSVTLIIILDKQLVNILHISHLPSLTPLS